MLVSEAMNRAISVVGPDAPVEEAMAIAQRAGSDHLLVLDEETLVGILCACDLQDAPHGEHVSECMSVPVVTVRPDAAVEEAATTMRECAVGCLPVQLGGLILGTLSGAELLRCGLEPPLHCGGTSSQQGPARRPGVAGRT